MTVCRWTYVTFLWYFKPVKYRIVTAGIIFLFQFCFGSCSFCALTMHQGRIIQSRSKESVVDEAKKIIKSPSFKGYIHDVGGPTANFRQPACKKQLTHGACKERQCLFPKPCLVHPCTYHDAMHRRNQQSETPYKWA